MDQQFACLGEWHSWFGWVFVGQLERVVEFACDSNNKFDWRWGHRHNLICKNHIQNINILQSKMRSSCNDDSFFVFKNLTWQMYFFSCYFCLFWRLMAIIFPNILPPPLVPLLVMDSFHFNSLHAQLHDVKWSWFTELHQLMANNNP